MLVTIDVFHFTNVLCAQIPTRGICNKVPNIGRRIRVGAYLASGLIVQQYITAVVPNEFTRP